MSASEFQLASDDASLSREDSLSPGTQAMQSLRSQFYFETELTGLVRAVICLPDDLLAKHGLKGQRDCKCQVLVGSWEQTKEHALQDLALRANHFMRLFGRLNGLNHSIASTVTGERWVRTVPSRLCLKQDPLGQDLYLHKIEVLGTSKLGGQPENTLGLLLPMPVELEMSTCISAEAARCHLYALSHDRIELQSEELRQASLWSLGILGLFRIPIEPLATVTDPAAQPLVLDVVTGEYHLGPPLSQATGTTSTARDVPGFSHLDEPCCLAVPLLPGEGAIDWQFINFGTRVFASGRFPGLLPGLAHDGSSWVDCAAGISLPTHSLVVSAIEKGVCRKRRLRHQFFTHIKQGESTLAESSRSCTDEVTFLQAGAVLHRSFALSGLSMEPLPTQDCHGNYTLDARECTVVPLTALQARAAFGVPLALWHAEFLLGVKELQSVLASKEAPIEIDRRLLSLALTCRGVTHGYEWNRNPGSCGVLGAVQRAAGKDNERLEFLGDALLKFVSRALAFHDMTTVDAGTLSKTADEAVTNKLLRTVADVLGLQGSMLACPFSRHVRSLSELRLQALSWKAPADAVEAMIAAIWLTGRTSDSLGCADAARRLEYFFRHYVAPLVSHKWSRWAAEPLMLAGMAKAGEAWPPDAWQAERWELLGDAVLQALVSEHLFFALPSACEGRLSAARSWLVGNAYLGRRAAHWLREERKGQGGEGPLAQTLLLLPGGSAARDHDAADPSQCLVDDRTSELIAVASPAKAAHVPKCLGDLYEVAVGGTFLASGRDLRAVWDVYREDFEIPSNVLQELLEQHMATVADGSAWTDASADVKGGVQEATVHRQRAAMPMGGIRQHAEFTAAAAQEKPSMTGPPGLSLPEPTDGSVTMEPRPGPLGSVEAEGEAAPDLRLRAAPSLSYSSPKTELNGFVMQQRGPAWTKQDVMYTSMGPLNGLFQATVRVVSLKPDAKDYLEFQGSACRTKKEAEQSAAASALRGLGCVPPDADNAPPSPLCSSTLHETANTSTSLPPQCGVSGVASCPQPTVTPETSSAEKASSALDTELEFMLREGMNAKAQLNNLVMKLKGSPLSRDDILYTTKEACAPGLFQMAVRLAVLKQGCGSMEFLGDPCKQKRQAEHSAAAAALRGLSASTEVPVGCGGGGSTSLGPAQAESGTPCAQGPAAEGAEAWPPNGLEIRCCEACGVEVNGMANWQKHCEGKRHLRMSARSRLLARGSQHSSVHEKEQEQGQEREQEQGQEREQEREWEREREQEQDQGEVRNEEKEEVEDKKEKENKEDTGEKEEDCSREGSEVF